MFKHISLILLVLFTTNCGAVDELFADHEHVDNRPHDFSNKIDEVFIPYYKIFERIKGRPTNVPISFGDTNRDDGRNVVGLCQYGRNWRRIIINKNFWDNTNEGGREVLVLHELGHCALNRDHTEETMDIQDGRRVPKSIMYPSVIGVYDYYTIKREHYLKELVNP